MPSFVCVLYMLYCELMQLLSMLIDVQDYTVLTGQLPPLGQPHLDPEAAVNCLSHKSP